METAQVFTTNTLDSETQMLFHFVNKTNFYITPHSHEFFEMLFVLKGSFIHNVNGIEELLKEGSLALICPSQCHYYNIGEDMDSQLVKIAISTDTMQDLLIYLESRLELQKFLTTSSIHSVLLSECDRLTAKIKLESLAMIQTENKNHIKAYLRLIIADFMLNFITTYEKSRKPAPTWLVHLTQEMHKRENFSIGIYSMESISNLTLAYIGRFFKMYYNTTPTDFINDLRLNYCTYKLIHSNDNILDIALDAGFNNLSHFYHLFKKHYNISPLLYRKKHQASSVIW